MRSRSGVASGPDLYAPSSPGYRERARETVREIIPGMTLVTLGHPIDAPPAPSFPSRPASAPSVPPEEPAPASQPTAAAPLPEYKPGLGRG